jgi:hypothetical protein
LVGHYGLRRPRQRGDAAFFDGFVFTDVKADILFVRAVRSGL